MVDELDAGGVDPDVVGGPAAPELVAAGGQLADEVGRPAGRRGRGRPRRAAWRPCRWRPCPSRGRTRSRAGRGRRTGRCWAAGPGRRRWVSNSARPRSLAARMSRRPLSTNAGVPIIESTTRCTVGRTLLRAGRRRGRAGRAGGADQVEQVRPLGLIELQRVRDAVDDALGDAGGVAPLEPGVVLGARCRRGAATSSRRRPGDPSAVAAIHGQPRLLGADPGPSGGQELPDLAAHVTPDRPGSRVSRWSLLPAMSATVTSLPAGLGVTASTPFTGTPPPRRGLVQWLSNPRITRSLPRPSDGPGQRQGVHSHGGQEGLARHRRRPWHGRRHRQGGAGRRCTRSSPPDATPERVAAALGDARRPAGRSHSTSPSPRTPRPPRTPPSTGSGASTSWSTTRATSTPASSRRSAPRTSGRRSRPPCSAR